MPSSQKLRYTYADKIFTDCKEKAQKDLHGHNVCIEVDETTDAKGQSVAGFIVSSLDDPSIGPYLIHLKHIQTACNTEAYVQFIMDGLLELYPSIGEYRIPITQIAMLHIVYYLVSILFFVLFKKLFNLHSAVTFSTFS